MIAQDWTMVGLLGAALTLGTLSDTPRTASPLTLGGYRVLAADFHVHSFPLSWATLAPWDTVLEARHQALDVIAMTGHNHVWVAQVGRWFSQSIGGPTVLVGEEIVAPRYHLLAIGIHSTVSWKQTAARAIAEVHRQGGVAIAAHPVASYWPAYDRGALQSLDGAEILQPIVYVRPGAFHELQEFFERAPLSAVGDSDFHGLGPMGICRTYVFANEDSDRAVIEALRARRTVVYDRDGHSWGDPELIRVAARDPRFQQLRSFPPDRRVLVAASRICGFAGLLLALILWRPQIEMSVEHTPRR
jgi:hypothetical protein